MVKFRKTWRSAKHQETGLLAGTPLLIDDPQHIGPWWRDIAARWRRRLKHARCTQLELDPDITLVSIPGMRYRTAAHQGNSRDPAGLWRDHLKALAVTQRCGCAGDSRSMRIAIVPG